ncbi:MAG: heme-copper oxidase subunit III [Chloroflexota bacterium]|nr:MAG: heme-copper oxidase subunit III [Chloroflexota bacterium]
MWTFLASDCMFFGALIANFITYFTRNKGTSPYELLNIPYTSVSAFVLLMSSLTMVLALAAIQRGDEVRMRIWLVGTALLGSVFVGGQYFEFNEFYHKGMQLTGVNLFSSAFFLLTGTHGLHVTIGIIWLLSLVVTSFTKGIKRSESLNIEIVGLYWHFVDVVWIIIFAAVYLMGTTLTAPR